MKKKEIWSFIGAGGKSTLILLTAGKKAEEGKKVLITTTVHTAFTQQELRQIGGCLTDGKEASAAVLQGISPVAAVEELPGERGKQQGISEEDFQKAAAAADLVLIEADGSRRRPFKAPGSHEPVIRPECSRIILTAGLTALGQPVKDSCHRTAEVIKCTGKPESFPLTCEDMARVIREGYLKKCEECWPDIPVTVILNQADEGELREKGLRVRELLEGSPAEVWLFSSKSRWKGRERWNMN